MKCKNCDGTGKVVHPMMSMNGDDYTGEWEQHECEMCGGTGEIQQTEKEYIQTCNTEQLAEFIIAVRKGCVYADCPNGETPCMSCKDGCDIDKLVVWLKQPHHEKE